MLEQFDHSGRGCLGSIDRGLRTLAAVKRSAGGSEARGDRLRGSETRCRAGAVTEGSENDAVAKSAVSNAVWEERFTVSSERG